MTEIVKNPLFGLVLSIGVYVLFDKLYKRYPTPLFTPLLLATITIIAFLKLTGISYEDYYQGGSILNMFIVPSTVALAIPMYRNFERMKHHFKSIIFGIGLGALVNTLLTVLFVRVFDLEDKIAMSIFPRSVTTAMALGISEEMRGIMSVTIVAVAATGLLTSVIGIPLLKLFKISDPIAQGIAMGATGHAIGTGKAFELGKTQGAMGGLSIGLTGIFYVMIVPVIVQIFF
ncbi:MAG: LrgB family protein [Streptococcaceae bacterium]|jgi:predicted murein hydrolase (TIGR00659 family)|nr:LrgB family protein [Streptococcaceae bacterium]